MKQLALRVPSPSIINRAVAQLSWREKIICELLISKLFKLHNCRFFLVELRLYQNKVFVLNLCFFSP